MIDDRIDGVYRAGTDLIAGHRHRRPERVGQNQAFDAGKRCQEVVASGAVDRDVVESAAAATFSPDTMSRVCPQFGTRRPQALQECRRRCATQLPAMLSRCELPWIVSALPVPLISTKSNAVQAENVQAVAEKVPGTLRSTRISFS